ncbi:50S ribosomal protein L13 [Candidatus Daviesbacteria bacterium RIFCSPLOWO2_02_FULL_41_8]|uniref:Large ribosomal subunit protein uL13 n=3 Tax=Candidatus Daviesiibacteriota TaxID=1752718 RepID=A0A1F5NLW1_9BACT|nr:MAG: 50S ribosomal protein L13 [Candidatus Daviesbacteria bacterium RIFCSPHIGHO2_01_FULL_41_23]OGE32807.1 MAG: 50S ribosomal protein L13 [Candidatus Daviesbacteria bacterium RIFCSPHIGHO2_02_FULL_41_10]OGE62153.1 MAG: 50S ribosomal protein L13 [Candidatus Daviesbacteria bacterium RIFCSPLOWO2_01_FULL_41_32]OGE78533.1 MAG: 50S ribosomal protein L13 [Candidatus Daviesbacteria bacterium RIFCSPLOWO2_02_FULL_41_8]
MSTNTLSAKDIKRETYTIDAGGKILGRLATEVATILMGKKKPQFVPYLDTGDFVVVTNAKEVKVTGKKRKDKIYASHSGYPGGLKTETFDKMIKRKPEFIIEHAVKGMLPHNRLGAQMIKKLKVFAGPAKGVAKEAK